MFNTKCFSTIDNIRKLDCSSGYVFTYGKNELFFYQGEIVAIYCGSTRKGFIDATKDYRKLEKQTDKFFNFVHLGCNMKCSHLLPKPHFNQLIEDINNNKDIDTKISEELWKISIVDCVLSPDLQ